MSISVSNVVVTTDTFESWIDVTNQLCDAMTTRTVTVEANTTGAVTVGNAYVNGVLSANVVVAKDELRGGTVAAPANLTITSNASITGANAYISANVYINTGNTWVNTALFTMQGGTIHATSNVVVDGANTVALNSNVVTVGSNTLLVTANAVVSGANVVMSVANLSVTSGKLNISSNVGVTGLTTMYGNVNLSGTLQTISGNVNCDYGTLFVDSVNGYVGANTMTPDATLAVVGTANVSGNVRISGLTTLVGNTTLNGTSHIISGNVNIDTGTFFVDSLNNRVGFGNTNPDATLSVTGTANVSGVTRLANTLTVVGSTTLSNTANVIGDATFNSNVAVVGITNLNANVVMSGALQTIAGNVNFDTGTLFVDSSNDRVGMGTTTPDATLAVAGTANVTGASRFANTLTVVGAGAFTSTVAVTGNTVVGSNALFVSTAAGNTRVGIVSDVAPYAGVFYSLSVGGNTVIKDGNLVLSNGYIQTNQLKINTSGGLQLGENVALTFAGLIVGDVLPAYVSGSLTVNTSAGNNVVIITSGNTDNLALKYTVVEPGVFVSNTVIESIINSTSFTVSNSPLTSNTGIVIDFYSRYQDGALASYALGSLVDENKRWEAYTKLIVNNGDITTHGKLDVTNTSTTHTIGGNVSFDSGTLFVDSANNKIGINNTAPSATLTVTGTASVSGNTTLSHNLLVSGNATISGNVHTIAGNVNIDSGVLYVDGINNRVGINNTAPTVSLQVTGTSNVSAAATFGNTVTVAGNTNIGSGNVVMRTDGTVIVGKSIKVANTGVYANVATMSTAAANTTIDQFAMSEFGTAKYVIDYRSTSNTSVFGAVEALVISNGTDVYMTEYAAVFSANISFSLDSAVSGGTCSLYASASQGNLSVNISRVSLV